MPKTSPCYTVGLTGGIASGKTSVSDLFKKKGIDVIDADIIAREVVQMNSIGLSGLIKAFGETILTKNMELDRSKLRKIIFNNSTKLAEVNSILHPLINSRIKELIDGVKNSYCIVVIPLLCESNNYNWLDRVLVVDVKSKTQLTRLTERDKITVDLADKMIKSQCSRNDRLKIADDVINNEQPLNLLKSKVGTLHCFYKKLYK